MVTPAWYQVVPLVCLTLSCATRRHTSSTTTWTALLTRPSTLLRAPSETWTPRMSHITERKEREEELRRTHERLDPDGASARAVVAGCSSHRRMMLGSYAGRATTVVRGRY